MSLLPPSPLLDETINPGQSGHIGDHEVIANILNNLATYIATAASDAASAARSLNIKDFGVNGDGTDEVAAVKAALDSRPGESFFFPPGDYRFDSDLDITENNSIVLDAGARIYAGAALDTLINYDNGEAGANDYSWDKGITGAGVLDGNLLANKCLRISSVLRFSLGHGLTIIDPIYRGIHAASAGAEIIAHDIRLYNTGTTNSHKNLTISTTSADATITATAGTFTADDVGSPLIAAGVPDGSVIASFTDSTHVEISNNATATASGIAAVLLTNIAIESQMGDCFWSDIIIRDFTCGVWNRGGSAVYDKVHPWIGTLTQLTARYPASVAFKTSASATMIAPYADTMRYGWQTDGQPDTRIVAPKFLLNTGNLSGALAAANPGAVFDLGTTGGLVDCTQGRYFGHPSVTTQLYIGTSRRFFHRNGINGASVTGVADFKFGVQLGSRSFTPTLEGSTTPGAPSYTTTSGTMEVRDGVVFYRFVIVATTDATMAGNLRIGQLPYPDGATAISTGQGSLNYVSGITANGVISGSLSPSGPPWAPGVQKALVINSAAASAGEVAVPAPSTAVQIWGVIEIPFTYPS